MMNKDHSKYVGFAWTNPKTGITKYYVFLVVPFGLLKAPYVCKHLFHPLIKTWQRLSIPCCLFYDDCVTGAYTKETAKMFADRQRIDMLKAHVLIAPNKSDFSASPTTTWLGHLFDMERGGVSITEERISRAEEKMTDLAQSWPVVSARQLARVVGSVNSCSLVLREEVQFMTRFLQSCINHREEKGYNWNKKYNVHRTGVAELAWRELTFWRENLRDKNFRPFNVENKHCKIVWGDAGEQGEGAHFDFGDGKQVFHSTYSEHEIGTSSTFRKLSAVHDLFLSIPDKLANSSVIYATDSISCHIIMTKGSTKTDLQSCCIM